MTVDIGKRHCDMTCVIVAERNRLTIITVTAPAGRLGLAQRRCLAESLTDAVLAPEIGQHAPAARMGFQVHFQDLPADCMAIGGRLLSDQETPRDVMTVNIAVMNAAWPAEVRAEVIRNVLARLAEACGMQGAEPNRLVNFQIIEEGKLGFRGGVPSVRQTPDCGGV